MRKKLILLFTVMLTFFVLIGTCCQAAWWGTPGYEWALSKGLTSIKTQSQLNREVTVSDYYSVLQKYLRMKNVEPKNITVQNFQVDGIYNGVIEGLVNDVNSYVKDGGKTLTPQEYRNLDELISHAQEIIGDYSYLLARDDLKNLNLYLDLARYRGAMLLKAETEIERQYKSNKLYGLRNTKYASSLNYGIMPMLGEPTRESFLVLMYNLLSDNNSLVGSDTIVREFNESGVLLGYSNSLWLNEKLKYSDMLTFLYRFEAFDFEEGSLIDNSSDEE